MTTERYCHVLMPDLGLDDRAVTVSQWLVELGGSVAEGGRLLEVVAPGVTVDVPSPASGQLIKTLVAEEEPLQPGQVLGILRLSDEP